ncbi:MAG: hypothetical protein FGM24_05460 [Candidatus Kapabacteria bacterium]|nr:hypothetical protein [Candidatus Kapabacteria bacterium]
MRRIAIIIMHLVASAFAVAQAPSAATSSPWMLGPVLGYGLAMAPPSGSTISGTPVRLNLGVDLVRQMSASAALRLTSTYRIEQAEYSTTVSEFDRPMIVTSKLNVGDDPGTESRVVSTRHTIGSVDLALTAQFTVMPIGTDGSHVFAGLGGMIDHVMTATQSDDWTFVSTLPVEYADVYDYDLGSQTGIGSVAYVGAALSLGTSRLVADVRYVTRTPIGDDRTYAWLAGRGLRMNVSLLFPL